MNVVVANGGRSLEREVSLRSGRRAADALLDLALSEAAERRATTRTFESVLISQHQTP